MSKHVNKVCTLLAVNTKDDFLFSEYFFRISKSFSQMFLLINGLKRSQVGEWQILSSRMWNLIKGRNLKLILYFPVILCMVDLITDYVGVEISEEQKFFLCLSWSAVKYLNHIYKTNKGRRRKNFLNFWEKKRWIRFIYYKIN